MTDVEASRVGSGMRQRKKSKKNLAIASRPFAGRIGGNQEFTVPADDTSVNLLPDAAAVFSWRQSFSPRAFADIELWKESFIEGVGTCLQTYLSGLASVGLGSLVTATALGPVAPAAFGSIVTGTLIALFIFGAGPVSGAHFNPTISMATFTAGLSIFPRTLLYIIFQSAGAVVAGALVRASLGMRPHDIPPIPGCYIDTDLVTPGEAYVLETMTSFGLIFIAFGVGLDPRQREVFGPALSPILVGLTQSVCTFVSSIVRPGYSGACRFILLICEKKSRLAHSHQHAIQRGALVLWLQQVSMLSFCNYRFYLTVLEIASIITTFIG
ncbi:hypothetical protein COCCADRAFT_36297 [Bipolaris zeicola 26-R-13]|uniref:Aquaporin n=1 Tax=Cochliobolus carbonum (strain 26-R-13) TaxID=930089 RepID=W6Y7P3_COCC2|nr:uncharacterized protein COCCADRAFT_36297 [Bipolaris zeicola 26-R-13]EUC33943.1 hypothetical protein COCCADRAFT_36297 [Bipolaris zeicola 26-R-13]